MNTTYTSETETERQEREQREAQEERDRIARERDAIRERLGHPPIHK